jgi:crotonobetainyl-CoA:carnitine CoA-transferase CaiB-like acyl-CoA transferase
MTALAGLRVLDLSRILAGPWCTQLLADFGAEVVKVEKPGVGDDTRQWGPPWFDDGTARTAAYFLAANRGKRSVCIDLAHPEGQVLLCELAQRADVLVENFKVGALARHGLDWASLSAHNPRLVYCSITGFGQFGPYAARPGYDAAIQAMGGLMSITGAPDGPPQKVGVAVSDLMTGMYAASAILAALRHRDATGEGQHIDLALFDTQVAWLANQAMNYLVGHEVPGRLGSAHPNIAPYQVLPCAGGHVMLAVGNDAQFRRLCIALGVPELADDARFASNAARVAQRETLIDILTERFAVREPTHWLALLDAAEVPCAPVNDLAQVFADPQIAARGLRRDVLRPDGRPVPQVANPVRFSATPPVPPRAPPDLGEHTADVLRDWLGLAPTRIGALRSTGAIA